MTRNEYDDWMAVDGHITVATELTKTFVKQSFLQVKQHKKNASCVKNMMKTMEISVNRSYR